LIIKLLRGSLFRYHGGSKIRGHVDHIFVDIRSKPNHLKEIDIKYSYIAGEDGFSFIMSILDVCDHMGMDYHTGLSWHDRDAAQFPSRPILSSDVLKEN
jgi:hypothetical protein